MKSLTLINKKIWEEKKKYFENFQEWGEKIKKVAQKILGKDVKVLIFGSTIKGEWGHSSDIDVLIISDKLSDDLEKNGELRTKIKKAIDPFSPFQIHLAREEEYKKWWKRFIKEDFIEF